MDTWQCDACGAVSDELWGACRSRVELRPVERGWPSSPSVILLYPGETQVDAAGRYRAHAADLGGAGYRAAATSWGEERPGAVSATLFAHVEEAYRVGTLLVTYHREVAR